MIGLLNQNIILEEKNKVKNNPIQDYQDLLFERHRQNRIEICAGRNYGKSSNLYRWTSWEPKTPFAPKFDCPMWCSFMPEGFADTVLDVVKEYEPTLGDWKTYNIFSWDSHIVNKLLMLIQSEVCEFHNELESEWPENIWIRGWMSIIDVGDRLPIHAHSFHENSFLSGNILLTNSEVSTEYIVPSLSTYYGNFQTRTRKGSMTLFPSWVEHYVPEVGKKRYCLAYDLYTEQSMSYMDTQSPRGDSDPMRLSVPLQ